MTNFDNFAFIKHADSRNWHSQEISGPKSAVTIVFSDRDFL